MNLGSIVRRATSAFAKSKTRRGPTTGPTTGPTRTTGGGSAKNDLARGAAKMAKKKL